ncbi:MAG: AzlD domain-containing protein [Erysipelotrichaceae bacterium]|nr:AzlD domain-containing protein [Erysipelotrichaceae bacterium]
MRNNIWIYVLVMALTVFAIRTLPLTLIRKPIQNRIIRDLLYYVPYVTLTVMTFPAILDATESPYAGLAALIIGGYAAYKDLGLFKVTVLCCISVLILELFV